MKSGNSRKVSGMQRGVMAIILVSMLFPSAFAFSLTDLFQPVLAVMGIAPGTGEECTCNPSVSLSVNPTTIDAGESVHIRADGHVSYSGDCKYKPYALRIKVYVDGELVRNFDCGAPYAPECTKGPFTFDYTFTEPGDHTVKAQMVWDDCDGATRDDAWDSVTVEVSGLEPPKNDPPIITSIDVEPSTTVEWGTFVTVTVTADDPDGVSDLDDLVVRLVKGGCSGGTVYESRIVSFEGGTASATLRTDWTKGWEEGVRIAPGDYNICITVYDDAGNTATAHRKLTITPLETGGKPRITEFSVVQSDPNYVTVHAVAEAGSGGKIDHVYVNVYRVYPDGTREKENWGYYLSATFLYCNSDYTRCEWTKKFLISSDQYGRFVYKAVAEEEDGDTSDPVTYPDSGTVVVKPEYGPHVWPTCPEDIELPPGSSVDEDVNIGFPAVWADNYLVKYVEAKVLVDGGLEKTETWSGADLKSFTRCSVIIGGRTYTVPCKLLGLSDVTVPASGSKTVEVRVNADFYGGERASGTCTFKITAAPTVDEEPSIKWIRVSRISEAAQNYRIRARATDSGKDAGITRFSFWVEDGSGKVVSERVDHYTSFGKDAIDEANVHLCVKRGTYYAVVEVEDRGDHVASDRKQFTVEDSCTPVPPNNPPTASISAPSKVSPGRTFDFQVCGKDTDGRVVQIAAKVGSADWQYKDPNSEGCAEFVATAPTNPITLTIYGKAKDNDGAWSKTVSATVEVNYSAPGIVKFDVPSRVYAGKEFNITVSARDVDNDIDRAVLVIKKGSTVIGRWSEDLPATGGTATFRVSVSEAGDYTATVTVYDAHGLSSSKSEGFSAVLPPNVPPVVDSVEVLGTVYVGGPFEMNVCAHDPDGDVEWISYVIQGGSSGAQRVWRNGCHIIAVPSPGVSVPGTYEMNVWAQDYRGAKSRPFRTTITVKERDTIPPRVVIGDVQDTNVPGEIHLRVRASDNVALSDANIYYKINNAGDWILAGRYDLEGPEYAFVASVPARVPGDYNIMVVVSDTGGNMGTAYALGRAVDQIPPTVRITAPTEVNQGDAFQFSVEVQDNYKIKHVSVKVDGDTIFDDDVDANYWSKDFTYTFSHASPHSITVLAEDYYSNDASGTHLIEVHPVDENAPVIDLNAWYDANTNYILWKVHVTDPNLEEVNIYLNGNYVGSCDVENGIADCGGGHSVDMAGTYAVKVVATDSYGNVAEESKTIMISDEPPVLNVSAPASIPVGGTATIHVEASDDFGLASIDINGFGLNVDENISGRTFGHDFNVLLPEEGNYTYTITVTDTAGQSTTERVIIGATKEGHSYDLVLTGYSGTTARVLVQGKIDGAVVDLHCSDVIVNIEPADTKTPMGSYTVHDTVVDGHSACEVQVTGTGKYIVRATWMGVTKGTVVTVFAESVAAPESVVVALVLGLVALGLLGRFI